MTHQPMSAFIVELLESAFPTIERMAVTFQKVKSAQVAERSRFLESLDRAQAAVETCCYGCCRSVRPVFDEVEGIVDGGGDGEGARCATRRRRRQRRLPPPPLTGGHRQ